MPRVTVRTFARLLAAAGVVAVLASAPTLSQSPPAAVEERVEMILGGLPAPGSPDYKALLKLAGNPAGQVLELTKCELWRVSRSRMSALLKAASEKNISVKVLDETWNQVLAPMPAAAMDDKSRAMRDMAMTSPSTGGVGMMSMRTASMVEYALTKGMKDRTAAKNPMTIRLALNDTTTVTAARTSVVIEGDRCIWRGVIEGTSDPVTIMWWGSGRMTGSIQHRGRIYQLKQFGNDTIGIVESMADKMPDDHARSSPRRMQDMKTKDDTLYMHGDSSAMRPRPSRSESEASKDAAIGQPAPGAQVAIAPVKPAVKPQPKAVAKSAPKAPPAVIDVMVVYTAKAARHYSDIGRDLIELAIEETNQSFRASRIGNVKVRLVHTQVTDYSEDGAEHFDHVWRMVDKGDGFMEEVPRLRDEKKADVVILIVDDKSGCGLATRVAADADEAYAVVHHECAATTYSLAHEIGHIIGTRHDRSLDQNVTPFAHGHGYVSPDLKWRTMMSYKAGCSGCPRLPVWSSPEKIVEGKAAGDAMHNNAAVIREHAARVAAFR